MVCEQVLVGLKHEMCFWGEQIHCFTSAECVAQTVVLLALGGEAQHPRNLPRAKQ